MANSKIVNTPSQAIAQTGTTHTQRTISGTAAAIINWTLNANTTHVFVQFTGANARVTLDGSTNPTTSLGFQYPDGSTAYNFDIENLKGDQIVINTDRLILSSRFGETLHFSKERYGIVTDSEYTVDAHDQIVMTTNNKTVFNSPAIYLGQYGQTNEPVLLGQTTVDWLYDLCNWLLNHVHWLNRIVNWSLS